MTVRATLVATLLALALSSLAEAAFISGVWQGDADFGPDGKFSNCTMTAEASSGVLIGFIISRDFAWGLVLADETHTFEAGATEAVVLAIDDRDPIAAIAKVIDIHGIVIPLENSGPVVEALREGKVLTIVTGDTKISFKLTGTKAAIAELAACVTENLNSEKVELEPPRTVSPAARALSAAREQFFDVSELQLDIRGTAVIALPGERRSLHVA